jgi:hypothetical protein
MLDSSGKLDYLEKLGYQVGSLLSNLRYAIKVYAKQEDDIIEAYGPTVDFCLQHIIEMIEGE